MRHSAGVAAGIGMLGLSACKGSGSQAEQQAQQEEVKELFFKISLAQWSFHKALFANEMDNLDFAATTKKEFGIDGVEYVNQFFKDKAKDLAYLGEMKKRAEDNGVRSLLIMIDGEGELGNATEKERKTAVDNHYKWIDAAKFLGCHSIRVNAGGEGTMEAIAGQVIKSLSDLGDYAATAGLNVIVENHGGYSSNADWLTGIMRTVNKGNVGTLPDFGNFCIKRDGPNPWEGNCVEVYDRYNGVRLMMPFARAVSAKTHEFDAEGNETETDYAKMMAIVKEAGYTGYVGIEYEGETMDEASGIRATKALLEKVGRI